MVLHFCCTGQLALFWVNYKFRLEIITPDVYRRCTLAGQQRTEIFICAMKNHHLISELPASKYTSNTTTSLRRMRFVCLSLNRYFEINVKNVINFI